MTETQTTAERIRAQIYYQLHGEFYSLETANEEVSRVSNAIAAEIDGLRRELAEARESLNAWRTMFPVNTPAEVAMKLIRGG